VYGILYLAVWIYLLPLPIIIGIYIRIVIYIKQNSFPTIIRHNMFEQQRQQCELRIFRQIIMPVIALFIMGFPYILFFLIIQFSHLPTPPYAQRICFMFVSFGHGISMLLCLINTDYVRKCLKNLIRKTKRRRRQRRVPCISVINHPVQIVPVRI
jgi:MFS superfamily sulfate permease-like transporter